MITTAVYLTARSWDFPSKDFCVKLAQRLCNDNIEVIVSSNWLRRLFCRDINCGVAIAFDFFRDNGAGAGIVLERQCEPLSRDFAYNVSLAIDRVIPRLHWRTFEFCNSNNIHWQRFFRKVNSQIKVIFYLCTYNNVTDYNMYHVMQSNLIEALAKEIIQLVHSNYNYKDYIYNRSV